MFDIVTIGSATRDNFLKVNYELIDWPKAPAKKAFVLPLGEKLEVESMYFTIGGNAANASVTFSRHGFKTACAAKIGSDPAGQGFIDKLKNEGVATKFLARSNDLPTAYSVLLLQSGERTILGYHGSSHSLSVDDLSLSKMRAKWWYISLSGESAKIYPDLVAFAKKNKIKIAVNPGGYHLKHRREEILTSLRDIDILFVNTGEAAELAGMSFEDGRGVFQKIDELMSPGIAVVTDGPRGAMISDGRKIYRSGIFKERAIIDRTGAGDAFGSGFVAIMARGGDIPEAIRFAAANSTAVVETLGATEGVLTRAEFEQSPRWNNLSIVVENI